MLHLDSQEMSAKTPLHSREGGPEEPLSLPSFSPDRKKNFLPYMTFYYYLHHPQIFWPSTMPDDKSPIKVWYFNPNWHEAGHFPPPDFFGLDFVSWIFTKNLQTFWEVKIDINQG